MKKLITIVLAYVMTLTLTASVCAKAVNPFVDVKESAWYYNEVVEA